MTSALIVAAGRGTRMGPSMDKLFLEVAGQPVIAHTWAKFDSAPCIDEIVLVVRHGMESAFKEIGSKLGAKKPHRFAEGGDVRLGPAEDGVLQRPVELVAGQVPRIAETLMHHGCRLLGKCAGKSVGRAGGI